MLINARNKFVGLLIFSFLVSCSEKNATEDDVDQSGKLKVAVVNYPLLFFAQTIAQEDIEIVYPIPPEEDPADWNPSSDQIAEFQNADIIFINGAGYARWIDKVSLPASKIISTTYKVQENYQTVSEDQHTHGPEGDHTHTKYAFTTWLDLSIAKSQVEAVYQALVKAIPDKEQEMSERYLSLRDQLDLLHNDLNDALIMKEYYGSHPVYQYLASGYDIEITSVHWEPDQDVSTEQWLDFEELTKNNVSNIMFWEGEPMPETKLRLKDLGIESIVFATCSNRPDNGDFINVMRSNIESLISIVN